MKRRTNKKSAALSSWLDALKKIAAALAPVPASVEGHSIPCDFRRLSIDLPPQSLIDSALHEVDGQQREELTRRAERLEGAYTSFVASRRKWREEVDNPTKAKHGELGELSDPPGKLQTLRRHVCDDVEYITGLLEPNKDYIGYNGGVSQGDFAALCGVDIKTVKNWENGTTKKPPTIFDATSKKHVTYSKEVRKDALFAKSFAVQWKAQGKVKRALASPCEYVEAQTEQANERARRGYSKSTAPRQADYHGETPMQSALRIRQRGEK